jgi:hypothetical protein
MNCASTDLNHPAGEADQKRGSVTEEMLRAVAAAAGSTPLAGCSLLIITEGYGMFQKKSAKIVYGGVTSEQYQCCE